jgi:hypothetical protein
MLVRLLGGKGNLYTAGGNVNDCNHYGELVYYPAIPLLDIYPKECKSGYNEDTCPPMFMAEFSQ